MGDSSGRLSGYNDIHTDIACAIDAFQRAVAGLTEVVMWGLCDAATASVFYASGDERVKGLVLVNPWVYSPQGAAKAYLKHYYLDRLLSKGFWRKVLKGQYNPFSSASSLIGVAVTASKPEPVKQALNDGEDPQTSSIPGQASGNLVQRFSDGLDQFKGPVLLILSGNDLTAAEFSDAANGHRKLGKQLARADLCLQSIPEADHTFSTKEWRENVEQLTIDWYRSLPNSATRLDQV
jgi:exosortase A-associated hydrolase 1